MPEDAPADGRPAPQPPNRAGSEVERRGGERSVTPADEERAELGPFAQVLPTAHEAASNGGLTVRVSGELAQLALLAPARLDALDAAVAQCLVNIVRHAGVSSAEVMIGGGSDELTVAVIDAGVGFDESRVPADRIGLRISIRARVEHEGGTVRLWSKPGVGTTIVLTMPRSAR